MLSVKDFHVIEGDDGEPGVVAVHPMGVQPSQRAAERKRPDPRSRVNRRGDGNVVDPTRRPAAAPIRARCANPGPGCAAAKPPSDAFLFPIDLELRYSAVRGARIHRRLA
jgi:hypothetical protein